MLDVHGVTGSSPVPRTTVKSPETITVSGLFVILTDGAAGILWKSFEKLQKRAFRISRRSKKQAASLTGEQHPIC